MNVFELAAIINLDTQGYQGQLANASKTTQSFGQKFGNSLKTAAKVGMAAITAVSAAVSAFAVSSVKTGMAFDKSMSQVAATMGLTVDQIGDLRDFAQEMGRTTVFSATQAADALNYMALAGYDANTSMAMLPNVLNLAAAGSMDLARASDMVTDTQTAFGITLERTSQMVDEMAKAASTGNTSVEQLGDAFLTVGGLAKNLNGGMIKLADGTTASVDGVQELEIALTAMANAGVKGSEAGTHMRNMLLKLASPTDEGAQTFERLGVKVFDAEGNMRSLKDVMGDLSGALSNLTQEEKMQAISEIFNTRDMASAEALLSAVNEDWDAIGESILNAQGAAQKMADTQLDNLAGDITLFKSALEGAQIAISDNLSPALRDFVQIGTAGLQQMTKGFKEGGLNGALDAFGDTLSKLVDKVVETAPKLIDAAVQLIDSFIKGIEKTLPKIANSAVKIITKLVDGIVKVLPQIIKVGIQLINKLTEGIAKALPKIIPAVVKMINEITLTFTKNIGQMVKLGMQIMGGIISGIIKAIPELVKATPQIIAALFKGILEGLVGAISGLVEGFLGGFGVFDNAVQEHFNTLMEKAHETIDAWHEVKSAQDEALEAAALESGNYESLLGELDRLTDANGNVKEGYEDRVAFIKNELQKYIGDEINLEQELIGNKQALIDKIQEVIAAKKAEKILSAQEEAALEAPKKRNELYEAQSELINKAKGYYDQYVQVLNGPQTQGTPYALQAINEQYQSAVSELQNVNGAIEETYNAEKVYQENTALMAEGTTESYQQIADSVNSLGETYSTNLETRKTQIEEEIALETANRENLIAMYQQTGEQWYLNEATASQARLDNLKTNLDATEEAIDINQQSILNKGEGWIGSFGGQGERGGASFYNGATGELETLPDDLNSLAVTAGEQANSGLEEGGDNGSAAQSFIDGALSILSYTAPFFNAGLGLAAQLVAGFNTGQDSHSPSKKAMQSARWFSQGVIIQAQKDGKKIFEVGNELGSMLSEGFDDSTSDFGFDNNFDGNFESTIKMSESDEMKTAVSEIVNRMDYMEDIMYNAFSRVLSSGIDLRWNDRELTRLVKEHA